MFDGIGLQLNCELFFGEGVTCKKEIEDILNIKQGQLPVKYLGFPLSSVSLRDKECVNLLDKIKQS